MEQFSEAFGQKGPPGGKPLAEVQATKPTAAFDEKWGKDFVKPEQFAAIAYASLKKG